MGNRKFVITMHCGPEWRLPDDPHYDPEYFRSDLKLDSTHLIASALPAAVAAIIGKFDRDDEVWATDVTINFGVLHAAAINPPDILITLDDIGGRSYPRRVAEQRRTRIIAAIHRAIDGAVGNRLLHEYPVIHI